MVLLHYMYRYSINIDSKQLTTIPLKVEFDSTAAVLVIKKKTNIVVIIKLQPNVLDAEVIET